MNKETFLSELKKYLDVIPKNEADDIIQYFLEFFEDSQKTDEEIIAGLGSPKIVAQKIIDDMGLEIKLNENQTTVLSNNSIKAMDSKKISFELINSKLKIISDDTILKNEIEIENFDLRSDFKQIFDGDTFTLIEEITQKTSKFFDVFFSSNKSNNIILKLKPNFELENLKARIANGGIDISNLKSEKTDLQCGNGNLNTNNIDCKNFSADIGNGKINLKGNLLGTLELNLGNGSISVTTQTLGKSNFNIGNGNIDIDSKLIDILETNAGRGNININTNLPEESFDLKIETVFGKVTVNNYESKKSLSRNNGNKVKIFANSAMGNITIN